MTMLNRIRARFNAGQNANGAAGGAAVAGDAAVHAVPPPGAPSGDEAGKDGAPATTAAGHEQPDAGSRPRLDVGVLDTTGHPLHYAFGHGRLHGQWRVDEATYQEYIRRKAHEEALEDQLRHCEAAIDEAQRTRTEAATLRGRAAAKEVEIDHARSALTDSKGRIQEVKQQIAAARERLARLHGRGSLGYGLLYGLTGLVFIVGDVALARYTVSKALRMNGWEGWAFACGLALLAIVLKPLYDRLIEDRFYEGHRRAFVTVITGAAIAVAVLLLILGSYRSDFMRLTVQDTDLHNRIEQIDTRISQLQQAEQLETIPLLESQRTELEQERGEIRSLIAQNQFGKWTLILAQLLFAVAGAICLGISFRHWLDWYHLRRPLRQQLGSVRRERSPRWSGTLYRELRTAENAHAAAQDQARRLQEDLETLRAQIEALEAEADVQARAEQARQRHDEAFAELSRVRGELFGFLYQTGHAVEQRLPELPRESWGDGVPTTTEDAGTHTPASPGRRPRRMYLAVRAAVRRAAIRPDAAS